MDWRSAVKRRSYALLYVQSVAVEISRLTNLRKPLSCCIDDETMAAPRVICSLAPSHQRWARGWTGGMCRLSNLRYDPTGNQARNQLGTPGGRESFPRGTQIFWTMSNIFKLCQHIFPGRGAENFQGGKIPPRLRACREPVFCGAYSTNEVIHPVIATRKIKMQHCFDSSHTFLYRIFAATSALTSTETQVIGRTLTSNSCAWVHCFAGTGLTWAVKWLLIWW